MDTKQLGNSNVVGGLVLIALGVIFFAATQGAFNLSWGTIWPAFVMLGGLVVLIQAFTTSNPSVRGGRVLGGTIPLLLGAFFFSITLGLLSWGDHAWVWPVYPLIVGVAFFAGYLASGRELPAFLIPGTILTLIGALFLGILMLDESYGMIGKLWPLFLIIGGVLMLVLPRTRTANS